MSKRAYTVLSPVEYDRLYAAGESIELEPAEAAQLLDIGALCEPDDPRAAAAAPTEAVEETAGILERALDALGAARPGEVREFFRRASEDPDISAKMERDVSRQSQLIAAIAGLEEGNEAHWTKSGKPEVRALREATGLDDATAAERDVAWTEFRGAEDGEGAE